MRDEIISSRHLARLKMSSSEIIASKARSFSSIKISLYLLSGFILFAFFILSILISIYSIEAVMFGVVFGSPNEVRRAESWCGRE